MRHCFPAFFALCLAAATALNSPARGEPERAQALDGTLYTVVAPTYTGTGGGPLTFMRFYNANTAAASTFAVTVLGSPSGQTYGSASYLVAANASLQIDLTKILADAGAAALSGGDTSYSLYLKNADDLAMFQHVTYSNVSGFFENLSLCQYFQGAVYSRITNVLSNVHTTRISTYPVDITVHNYTNAARAYLATVTDANTGVLIGKVTLNVGANTTLRLAESSLEQQLNFVPTANQFHINISMVDSTNAATLTAIIGQYVFNSLLSASVNMTPLCRVHP